jgi:hypothetical protein
MEEDENGGECNTGMEDMRNAYKMLVEKSRGASTFKKGLEEGRYNGS